MKKVSNKNFLFVILSILSATIIWMLLANNINPLVHERVSIPIEIRVDSEATQTMKKEKLFRGIKLLVKLILFL